MSSFSKEIQAAGFGTEAVLMGDHEDEDTFVLLDAKAKGPKKVSKGSGLGIYKMLSNRYWLESPIPIKVQIYHTEEEMHGKPKSVYPIKGFKDFIENKTNINGSFVMDPSEGVPPGTTAYWAVIPQRAEKKSNTNICSRGFTSWAHKGENYYSIGTHHHTNTANLKNAGIIYKTSQVVVVYEIPSDIEGLSTGVKRTTLYRKGDALDLHLANHAFREQFSTKAPALLDWMESQVVNKGEMKDHKKWLSDYAKSFKMKLPTTPATKGNQQGAAQAGIPTGNGTPNQPNTFPGNGSPSVSTRAANELARNKQALGQDGAYKLRRYEVPTPELIEDPDAPLVQFFLEDYKILVNKSHPLFEHRKSKCVAMIEDCMVTEDIENLIFLLTCGDVVYKIWETQQVYARVLTATQKQELLTPEILSGCWTSLNDTELLRKARALNVDRLVFASNKALKIPA